MATGKGSEHPSATQALVDDPDFLRGLLERAVQAIPEEQMTAHLGAAKHERADGRTGDRNGTSRARS